MVNAHIDAEQSLRRKTAAQNFGGQQDVFHFRSLDQSFIFVMGAIVFRKNADFLKPILSEGDELSEETIRDTLQFIFGGLGVKKLSPVDEEEIVR